MAKKIWLTVILLIASVYLISQGTGTPSTLRVITDANGYLITSTAAQTLPLSQPTTFNNIRLKTDANNYLITVPTFTAGNVSGGTAYLPSGTIYWQNVASSTSAGSIVPAFGTAYSIPATTLNRNGDRLYIRASVTLGSAATDNKNLNCNIGYSAFNTGTGAFTGGLSVIAESSTSNAGSLSWWVEAIVTRLGATSTSYEWQSKWGNTTTTQGANYATSSGITWANANNLLCAVYNTTAMNTEVLTLNEYSVTWQPYHP